MFKYWQKAASKRKRWNHWSLRKREEIRAGWKDCLWAKRRSFVFSPELKCSWCMLLYRLEVYNVVIHNFKKKILCLFGCSVFIAGTGFSLVVSGVCSLVWCAAFLLQWLLWLQSSGSRVRAQQPWHTGSAALRHVRSSRTRDRTCVPCIARQILSHWATREAWSTTFKGYSSL